MKKSALIILFAFITATIAEAQTMLGTWKGELNAGGQKLGLIFRIEKNVVGETYAEMDVPAQSAKGIPTEIVALTEDSVNLNIRMIKASYTGKLTGSTIKGTYTQLGKEFPLDLSRGEIDKPNRPQTPQMPYGYRTEEITFENREGRATLSGTLTYPVGYNEGKIDNVVIMVSGSGQQNRDEELFDHKPFLVIADRLAKEGIATLRYDDRGMGTSTGDPTKCTTEDFAKDAEAGIKRLKELNKFKKIGVLGHSEGAMIAMMIASEGGANFIVSIGGPGIKGDTLLTEQMNAQQKLLGQPGNMTTEQVKDLLKLQSVNEWMEYFINYDPAETLKKIKIPVMAINGSRDTQVIAKSNLAAIKRLLGQNNKKNVIKEYENLNHLMQHCTTGGVDEYYKIEETMAEEVMKDIAEWINNL